MSNELVINSSRSGLEIALLSDKKLIEYHNEKNNASYQVGDFYLGKVKKVVPSLNAAFVQIGAEKDAFLTYFDLGPNVLSVKKFSKIANHQNYNAHYLEKFKLEPKTEKTGKIGQVLKPNQSILVQIIKEPISNKGPKVTCDISLAGRYFVLVPFSNQVSLSKKIGSPDERQRLKSLIRTIKPENFGVIVRTVAENIPIEELDASLRELIKKWDDLVKGLKNASPKSLVLGEGNRVETTLRDIFDESFTSIVVNDSEIAETIKDYIRPLIKDSDKIVKHYTGKSPIFDVYDINKKIKNSFGKSVPFAAGAYLVIEHTEALHVIDVNSGNSSFDPKSREENVYKVNKEAVDEIARQVRLRDMGGIIIIDFIDLKDKEKRALLHTAMKQAMIKDKARHTILPLTKFGLMQITRERIRPETQITTAETCVTCNGTGTMENSTNYLAKLENQLEYYWENINAKGLMVKANPLIVSYIKDGFPSRRMKWWWKYNKWLRVESDETYPLNMIDYYDKSESQIK